MKKGKISIIIPTFNEEEKILSTINETVKVLDNLGREFELVIIDDGSIDNTYNLVKNRLDIFNGRVKIKKYDINMGKGYAIKYGFNFVSGEYVLFLDADMDIQPLHIKRFLDLMDKHKADIVIGSKRHKDSKVDYPIIRKIYSTCYYFLIRILFNLPVKDTQTGFKLFRYSVLKNCLNKIVVKKYAFDLEILVLAKKYKSKIIECPIFLKPTRTYYNRIGIKDIYKIFIDTIAILYRLYILKYYE